MSFPSEPIDAPGVVADIAAGRPVAAVWVNELGGVTFRIDGGLEYVKVAPPQWLRVGDCPFGPPVRVTHAGRCCGHVDLGDLGVADRPAQAGGAPRADLAVATLSLSWNCAGDWEHELFDAYGVDAGAERIDFVRASPSKLWVQCNAGDVSSH